MQTALLLWVAGCAAAAPKAPVEFLDDQTIEWKRDTLVAIDDEAVFYTQPLPADVPAMPPRTRTLRETIAKRGFTEPVRCRLVDTIDCTQTTHDFVDDGGSRVMKLGGESYRVTALPAKGFDLKWFSYMIHTPGAPGRPYLLVAQIPNDRERYTTLTLSVPRGKVFGEPYAGQEPKGDSMGFCQEPDCFHPDVGVCVYGGQEWPADGRPYRFHFLFYPKTDKMKLTVSSSGWIPNPPDGVGGAVSKIWVFELIDAPADRAPAMDVPDAKNARRFGMYVTHPWYFSAHYGVPANTVAQRRASYENLMAMLRFCGINWVEFNAINGSDRTGASWYPGGHFPMLCADLLSELPPVASRYGVELVPVITSLTVPGKLDDRTPNKYGFSKLSLIESGIEGRSPHAFNNVVPDPLRPETQAWLLGLIREIGDRSRKHTGVKGIGFRVNGKIGLCYTSWEDNVDGRIVFHGAAEAGYSPWDLAQFRAATKIDVPNDPKAAYRWLRERPEAWEAWLDFRCRRTRELWLAARDVVRSYRRDWNLYVLTDLPSEIPGTNIEWPGPGAPDAERVTLDALRGHGYDPRLYTKDDGIVIQRVMMLDSDRYWRKWGGDFAKNYAYHKVFHFQSFLPGWYRTPAGGAVELYHNYWEEPFHPDGEFGQDHTGFGLRTATATSLGRGFFEPLTFSMQHGNVDTIALMGWERPTLGHEHDLRRFAQAFRALPRVEPKPYDGSVKITASASLAPIESAAKVLVTDEPDVWVARFRDRLAIVNHNRAARQITLRRGPSVPAGSTFRDVATGQTLTPAGADGAVTIDLEPFDLRTLVIEPAR